MEIEEGAYEQCSICNGTGRLYLADGKRCKNCDGTGKVKKEAQQCQK